MPEKVMDIKNCYSSEMSEINNLLNYLEHGLVTENHSTAKMYGSLAHNASKLREEIMELIERIEQGRPSRGDIVDELYD